MKKQSILLTLQGVNFKLKLKKVAGYWNYDSSEFDRVAPLLDDDDAGVLGRNGILKAITAEDQFKKLYEQLETLTEDGSWTKVFTSSLR